MNKNEHRYEIRSSDFLFVFYVFTLFTTSISLYILKTLLAIGDRDHPADLYEPAACYLSWFLLLIGSAFIVEAWPRDQTRVQIESRQRLHLSKAQQANLFSRLTYHYMHSIVQLGTTRPLKGDDLENTVPDYLLTHVNYERVSVSWQQALTNAKKAKKEPSLMRATFAAYKGRLVYLMVWRLIGLFLLFVPSIMLGELLQFFSDYANAKRDGTEPPSVKVGLLIALAMLASNIFSSLILAKAMEGILDLGISARAAVVTMIYRKALKLSPAARQKSTLGEISK